MHLNPINCALRSGSIDFWIWMDISGEGQVQPEYRKVDPAAYIREHWDDFPKWYDRNANFALSRHARAVHAFAQHLRQQSDEIIKARTMHRAANPFKILPDPPLPYSNLECKTVRQVELIPMRIELEIEGIRISDTLCLNRHNIENEAMLVANTLVHDHNLPSVFLGVIQSTILDQAASHEQTLQIEEKWRSEEKDHQLYAGLRIPIRLHITVNLLQIQDKFEWALDDRRTVPEEFAETYCRELGLPLEFRYEHLF